MLLLLLLLMMSDVDLGFLIAAHVIFKKTII